MPIGSNNNFSRNGLILHLDAGVVNSIRSRPYENKFAAPTPDVNGNVTFAVQGTGTFQRVTSGTFADYTIKPTDIVYRYNLGGSGCHYHGNSAAIGSGQYVTYKVDVYASPDASDWAVNNSSMVVLENYGGSALSGGTGVNSGAPVMGKWSTITGYAGPTSGSGTQAMFLYPGGCGSTYLASRGFVLMKNPVFLFESTSNYTAQRYFAEHSVLRNANLEPIPNSPTGFNTANGASTSTGTNWFITNYANGSYNSKGGWDLYKTYSGLTTGITYTWSAMAKLGTATNLIVTLNNTQAWDTGPSRVFTTADLSTNEWQRISVSATTSSGSFNLHLGASYNVEVRDVVQTAGTVLLKDIRLMANRTANALEDLTNLNSFDLTNVAYQVPEADIFYFNKSTSCIDILNKGLIPGTSPFTIEAEIIVNSGTSGQAIIGNYGTGNTTDTLWFATHGLWINGACPYFPGGQLQQGIYTIAATRDASGNTALYKDGVLQATATNTTSITTTGQNWRIGKDVNGDGEPFDGYIYSIKVYNRALSADEIKQNFAGHRSRTGR